MISKNQVLFYFYTAMLENLLAFLHKKVFNIVKVRDKNVIIVLVQFTRINNNEKSPKYDVSDIAVFTFSAYAAFLAIYFILRLLLWDRLAIVGFIDSFIPYIFVQFFLFYDSLFFLKNKMNFIISCCAVLIILGWAHIKYWSPKFLDIANFDSSITVLSMNVRQHIVESEFLNNFILEQKPDIVFWQ